MLQAKRRQHERLVMNGFKEGTLENKIIHYSSDEAAHRETVTGWVSRTGHFFGDDERIARFDGCTHVACNKCGDPVEKGWTACKKCRDAADVAKFQGKERRMWDGVTPLCLYGTDTYFWDGDDITMYCEEHDCKPSDLKLMICEPVYAHEIDPSEYYDLPEDVIIGGDLQVAFRELNEKIREAKENSDPLCWQEGKYAVDFSS